MKAATRIDEYPHGCRREKHAGVNDEERVPAGSPEHPRADRGLDGIAQVANQIHTASRGAGVTSADMHDARPIRSLTKIVRRPGNAHKYDSVVGTTRELQTGDGG